MHPAASEERRDGSAWLRKKVTEAEALFDGRPLTRESEIELMRLARKIATSAAGWGVTVKTNNIRLARLLDSFQ
jgi:hypothetical protein